MCVCVCVCVCVCGAIAQLVRESYIWDLEWSQVQVTVMASYGLVFLNKKLTHICFSPLRSINDYVIIAVDVSGHQL